MLAWDCWNGSAWQELGRSGLNGTIAGEPPFSDDTCGLTKSGVVTLRLPDTGAKTAVNGQENFWLRVRLVKGNYGKEASYVLKDPARTDDGFTLVPASFRPPIIAAIKIGYELTSRRSPDVCFAFNQLAFTDCTQAARGEGGPFAPFVAASLAERPGALSRLLACRPDERRFRTRRSASICAWPSPGTASALCRCRRKPARASAKPARR